MYFIFPTSSSGRNLLSISESERFDKIATKFDYGLNAAAKAFDGENKYIRITDIDEGSNKYSLSDVVSPDCELDEDYLVKENDILFARTGASTGKTYLYNKDDGKMFFAGFLIRANIHTQNNAYFIFSQTLTERYDNWVRIFSMRSGQPGINAQEYKSFEVLLPPLPEQQKIAEILSTQDKLIELQEKKIEQLKELKKAYLQKMFPKKGSKYPELRFKGFTDPWEQRKLGDVTTYKNGKGYEDNQSDEGNYELINLNSISIDGGLKPSGKFIEDGSDTLLENDLVMVLSDVGHGELLGRVAIIPENNRFVLNQRVALLRINGNTNPYFLFTIINCHQDYFKKLGAGSSQLNISRGTVEDFIVDCPCQEEQRKIAEYFQKLDSLITLHQRKSKQEKQKKKALMQLLLTGKVRCI